MASMAFCSSLNFSASLKTRTGLAPNKSLCFLRHQRNLCSKYLLSESKVRSFTVTKAGREPATNAPDTTANPPSVFLSNLARKTIDFLKKPAVAAAIILTLMMSIPDFALAANSGGRVGGRNFSSRSYSAPPSRGQVYSSPSVVSPSYSMPFFAPSPFGWSPFSFGPTIVVGGGGFGGIIGFFFLGTFLFFLFNTFFMSSNEDDMYMTETTTVVRLQIGLLGIARGLQKDLDRIAMRADTSTPEGLHYILTETTLSLMRNPNYCAYGYSTNDVKNSAEEAEAIFNRISLEERGKMKNETLVNVNDRRMSSSSSSATDNISSEYIVVTIVAAAEGKIQLPDVKNSSDLKEALSILGSIPSEQLQAVEILWTPQADGDTLSSQEMMMDYPNLRNL